MLRSDTPRAIWNSALTASITATDVDTTFCQCARVPFAEHFSLRLNVQWSRTWSNIDRHINGITG